MSSKAFPITTMLSSLYAALETYSLSSLQLSFEGADGMLYPVSFFGDATGFLTPLHSQSWRALRRLTVHFESMFTHINDLELRAFATACPELVAFEFVHHPEVVSQMQNRKERPRYKDAPKLSTIIAFTTAHPHLERLTLPCFDVHFAEVVESDAAVRVDLQFVLVGIAGRVEA